MCVVVVVTTSEDGCFTVEQCRVAPPDVVRQVDHLPKDVTNFQKGDVAEQQILDPSVDPEFDDEGTCILDVVENRHFSARRQRSSHRYRMQSILMRQPAKKSQI